MGRYSFSPLYDDDEERISLVNVAAPIDRKKENNSGSYDNLSIKTDSDSDEDEKS